MFTTTMLLSVAFSTQWNRVFVVRLLCDSLGKLPSKLVCHTYVRCFCLNIVAAYKAWQLSNPGKVTLIMNSWLALS